VIIAQRALAWLKARWRWRPTAIARLGLQLRPVTAHPADEIIRRHAPFYGLNLYLPQRRRPEIDVPVRLFDAVTRRSLRRDHGAREPCTY
jgi:hypothetical protein